jgi:hypothetical protein
MAYDYLNPNYDEWGRQAIDRVNNVYAGAEDQIRAQRQQTQDYNLQQQEALNRGLMQRYGDLQRSVNAGAADLAGQGIRPSEYGNLQLQALQNAANAQNTYQAQQRQLYDNLTNDRIAGIQAARNAFATGVWGDVHQAKIAAAQAAASARGGGGGGGGGRSSGGATMGAPTDAEIMARMRLLNSGRVKQQSGLDWLKSNYANVSSPRAREVYNILLKTRGASAQELMRKYGQQRRVMGAKGPTATREPVNPFIYTMLTDFIKQRNAYHNAGAGTMVPWEDAYQSLLTERGLG